MKCMVASQLKYWYYEFILYVFERTSNQGVVPMLKVVRLKRIEG